MVLGTNLKLRVDNKSQILLRIFWHVAPIWRLWRDPVWGKYEVCRLSLSWILLEWGTFFFLILVTVCEIYSKMLFHWLNFFFLHFKCTRCQFPHLLLGLVQRLWSCVILVSLPTQHQILFNIQFFLLLLYCLSIVIGSSIIWFNICSIVSW